MADARHACRCAAAADNCAPRKGPPTSHRPEYPTFCLPILWLESLFRTCATAVPPALTHYSITLLLKSPTQSPILGMTSGRVLYTLYTDLSCKPQAVRTQVAASWKKNMQTSRRGTGSKFKEPGRIGFQGGTLPPEKISAGTRGPP